MSTIGNIFQQTNPYETFVQQLVQLESQTKLRLQLQQSVQKEKKTALGAVSSSISTFISKIEELQETDNKALQPLSSSTSDKDVVNINSTSGLTKPAAYNITIDRLAKNDIALSQIMTGDDTSLSSFGDGSITITVGEQTEIISVETTYEDELGATVQKTNSEILTDLSEKINTAFEDVATASNFNVNSTDVQFSVQSLETGVENKLEFSGSTGALAEIFNNVTHVVPQADLDAKFTIDGVTFERGENTIDDAIDGLTFSLLKATGEEEKMTVTRDLNKARSNIKSLIGVFNEVNKTIRDRTFIDSENDRRGALQDMRSIRNLTLNLRQTALLAVEGVADGELARLSEIGIGFENDGSMVIEDQELLDQMLEERPDEVERLFVDENSVITQMKTRAEAYTKSESGIIASLENGLDQKIDRLDDRIESQNEYLAKYEERQRAIFNELQLVLSQAQSQYDRVVNFRNSIGY